MDKVTHLEITRGVEQQVAGLEVAVQHVGRVDVLEAAQDLVEEVAHVVVAQLLRLEQLVHVRLHQALHDVADGVGQGGNIVCGIFFGTIL